MKRSAAGSQGPCRVGTWVLGATLDAAAARTNSSVKAPDKSRTNVKLAASTSRAPSASRQRIELDANATRATAVRSRVTPRPDPLLRPQPPEHARRQDPVHQPIEGVLDGGAPLPVVPDGVLPESDGVGDERGASGETENRKGWRSRRLRSAGDIRRENTD